MWPFLYFSQFNRPSTSCLSREFNWFLSVGRREYEVFVSLHLNCVRLNTPMARQQQGSMHSGVTVATGQQPPGQLSSDRNIIWEHFLTVTQSLSLAPLSVILCRRRSLEKMSLKEEWGLLGTHQPQLPQLYPSQTDTVNKLQVIFFSSLHTVNPLF